MEPLRMSSPTENGSLGDFIAGANGRLVDEVNAILGCIMTGEA